MAQLVSLCGLHTRWIGGEVFPEYRIEKPLVRMVRELVRRPALRYVYIERGELKIELRAAH